MGNGKKTKAILFDLGSTLIYFDGLWDEILEESYLSLAEALTGRGVPIQQDSFAAAFKERMSRYFAERESTLVEQTTANVLKSYLAELEIRNMRDEDLEHALDSMYQVTEARWRLEKDTIPLLEDLSQKGYRLGLVSNAADSRDVERLIDAFQLRNYFAEILISASVGVRKPHPLIFRMALEGLGAAPEEAMMVGDTLQADVLGANRLGIKSVWITRRVDSVKKQNDAGEISPDHVIENLRDLVDILE